MTGPTVGRATVALEPLMRELYDVLMAARVYVLDSREWSGAVGDRRQMVATDAVLERIDGVLADAGGVLS